jgi:hypothetical protein
MLRITRKFWRRSAQDEKNILSASISDKQRPGLWLEFEETWECPRGVDIARNKKRVSQSATGKVYRFLDHVTPEFLEDNAKERRRSKNCLVLMLAEDFSCLRLLKVR